jgi:transposase
MKNNKNLKPASKLQPRQASRYFSEAARKAIVSELEKGEISKAEAARKYNVSEVSIYNWIRKYSNQYQPQIVTVVEHQSDSKKNKALEAELAKAYEMLGRLQAENMFLEKIVELADEHFATDLKKNFATKPLPNSTTSEKKSF